MGNALYDENKQLKREIENLRESLRLKVDRDALPNMLEGVLFAFFQNRASFKISETAVGNCKFWDVRFQVDLPQPPTI